MTELKEFRLTISGKADVVIHDGPNNEALALRADHVARSGGIFRRRTYILVDKAGHQLLRVRRETRSSHADAVPVGGALVWASRFQTRYRIALSNGITWLVHVPLFTEKLSLSSTGTSSTVQIQVIRKNHWRVLLAPTGDESVLLSTLALILTERWNSSYGTGYWQAVRLSANQDAQANAALY
jgi:hypothetical protein